MDRGSGMSVRFPQREPSYWWERRRTGEQTPMCLGRVLDELGLRDMARRAREGHFDDFFAPAEVADGLEILRLYNELAGKLAVMRKTDRRRVRQVMEAVKAGEFDATKQESDRWAASKDGQDTMRALVEGR
jgi:hypothetical protein